MANSFTVNLIKAKSEVPLHLYGTSSVATTAQYRDLWRPAGPIADSFVAFDLGRLRTNASTIVNLRLTCTFGQNFVEKSGLVVEGFLDNTSAMKSPVTVTDTEQIIVQSFVMANRRLYPVSYKGEFEWKLMDGSTVAATFATKTPLELYTIVPFTTDESTIQWTASGVSVNLLRRYLVPWRAGLQGLGDFYSYAAGAIFQSPFVYNNVDGNYRYLEMPGDTPFGEMNDPDKLTIFKLGEYFRELEQAEREEGTTYRVNCRDMAGIVQIVLSLLLPKRSKGYHIRMQPFGYIKTTNLKGWGQCNNPFWGNTQRKRDNTFMYDQRQIAPDGSTNRSYFGNHVFIGAPAPVKGGGERIIDCTCGPHVGDKTFRQYLVATMETPPSTQNPPKHGGIRKIIADPPAPPASSAPRTPPTHPTTTAGNVSPHPASTFGITSSPGASLLIVASNPSVMAESTHFTTEGTHPKPIRPTPPVEPAPSAEGKESSQNLVDAAMECAIVKDAKPPRFSRIDPASLISMLEEKLGSTVTFKHVAPSAHGSHAQWNFGTQPNDVEVNLVVVDSHKAALGAMRGRLSCISAPVDEVFHQSIPLGQYSLQGTEHVLFIRGNVFVTLTGLPSSAKLGDIAKSVDSFLEKREGDIDTVPVPTLVQKPPPIVPLTIGQEFEIAVKVKDAQWMTTTFQPVVVQLLAVDEARATFRFCALSKGKVDIPLLFTHKDTLRTLTVTVHVEVTGGDDTKGDKGTGKDLGETELDSLYD